MSGFPRHPDAKREMRAREAYDSAAPYYDRRNWRVFWERNEAPVIRRTLKNEVGCATALDVGTGTGIYLQDLATNCSFVVGVDVSYQMLLRARNRSVDRVALVQGDVQELPVASRSVDVVLLARVLSNVENLGVALGEIRRILVPGGAVIVTDVHSQHKYASSRMPTEFGALRVKTYKRHPDQVCREADRFGLKAAVCTSYRYKDLRWQPGEELESIDRSSANPIFFVVLLRKGIGLQDAPV